MPLLIVARLTLQEALRRRLLLAVAILTVALIALTGWGVSKLSTLTSNGQPLPHAEVLATMAALVILLAYMFSTVLAVGAAFLAAPAIAADVESGLLLAMLPRPLRRSEFVLGRWLGLTALLVVYTLVIGGVELALIDGLTGYLPPHPVVAVIFLAGQGVVLLTLALLGSTRLPPMTGGIVAIALFGVAWIAGIAAQIGAAFDNSGLTTAGTVIGLIIPTDGLWRSAVYNLEPAALIALTASEPAQRTNPFVAAAPPPTALLIWAACWIVVVLALATWRFARRDL